MNRRGFIKALGAAFAAVAVGSALPFDPISATNEFVGLEALAPLSGTIVAINRSTYSFWRNQQCAGGSVSFDAGVIKGLNELCGRERP
jgi:hypothetical protein